MITFERCHPAHLALIDPQPGQEADRAYLMTLGPWITIATSVALSGFAGGVCLGSAGVLEVEPGKALVWALLSRHAGPHMLAITRKVRRVLATHPTREITATCDERVEARVRWMRALGFERTDEVNTLFDGTAVTVYRRVQCPAQK